MWVYMHAFLSASMYTQINTARLHMHATAHKHLRHTIMLKVADAKILQTAALYVFACVRVRA